MTQIRSAIVGILALFAATAAVAQTFPTVPPNTVIGRLGGGTSGPSQAIPFATLGSILTPGSATVESCGAIGDGVTDDAPAIRSCAATVAARPLGGKVQFACNKTYLLGSKDTTGNGWALLRPYNNVTYEGCGDSSVVKVKAGMNTVTQQFLVFYPPDDTATYTYSNIAFKNFKIDENGANNIPNAAQNVAIGCDYCTGVLIEGITFVNNPGSQYVQIGRNASISADTVKIINNKFGDACEVINPGCTDFSAVYVVANNYTIANNSFVNSVQSTKSAALEMHGTNGTATGNTVKFYSHGINIAALSHLAQNMTVVGNTFISMQTGIRLWHDGTSTLSDIVITGNTFQQSVQHATFPFFNFETVSAAGAKNLTFSNNNFSSGVAAGTANTTPTLMLGRAANQLIAENTFNGGLGPCIGAGTFGAVTSFIIRDNTLIDCGQTSTAGGRRGILISSGTTIDSVVIDGNRIENVASTYMTTGIDITLNVTYGYIPNNNLISNIVTVSSVSGSGYSVNVANSIPYSVAIGWPYGTIAPVNGGMLNASTTGVPSMTITPTLGVPGTSIGTLCFANVTSGCVKLAPATGALGTSTLTLPAATDTLVGKATTDTLTNKTFNTAGTGNVFQINGTGITAVTGSTGTVMLQTAPTFVTSMTGPLLIGGTGTTSTLTLQPTSGAGTTNANIVFKGGNNGATTWGTWQDGGLLTIGATPSTGDLLVLNGAANQGVTVANGSGSNRILFRWNTGAGGYFQIADTTAASTVSMAGTNTVTPQFIAPTGGVDFGINTQTPASALTGVANVLGVNGVIKGSVTAVGTLPTCNAANDGARLAVNNSNAASFTAGIGAVVAAGGTTHVPVYCDGTNWRIGANDNIPAALRRNYAEVSAYRRAA